MHIHLLFPISHANVWMKGLLHWFGPTHLKITHLKQLLYIYNVKIPNVFVSLWRLRTIRRISCHTSNIYSSNIAHRLSAYLKQVLLQTVSIDSLWTIYKLNAYYFSVFEPSALFLINRFFFFNLIHSYTHSTKSTNYYITNSDTANTVQTTRLKLEIKSVWRKVYNFF